MNDPHLDSFIFSESGSGKPFCSPLFYAFISPKLNQEENDNLILKVKMALEVQALEFDRARKETPNFCTGFTVTGLNNDETRSAVWNILSQITELTEINPFKVIAESNDNPKAMHGEVSARVNQHNEAVVSFRGGIEGNADITITRFDPRPDEEGASTLTIVVSTIGFSGGPDNVITKLVLQL